MERTNKGEKGTKTEGGRDQSHTEQKTRKVKMEGKLDGR